jgi:choline dehydrogenase-like flavoprotein
MDWKAISGRPLPTAKTALELWLKQGLNTMNQVVQPYFDAIVVGTGPGGATVARDLSKVKKNILLLEWGSKPAIKGSFLQLAAAAMRPGKGALFTPEGLAVFRSITTGGSSVAYYATILEPPYAELKRFGIDISEEADEVRKELPTAPLTENLIGPFAKRIMASARELGYRWDPLKKFVYQEKCRPDCDKCVYGCPYGAKWNARMYVEEAVDSGAILVNGAKITRVLIEQGRAVGVEFKKEGAVHQVLASKIVVSAGGIGSPIILRASGIKEAGNDFFFDPLIGVFGTV